jgi:3-(methylthio)propanoyl-CoA dehydrogenase
MPQPYQTPLAMMRLAIAQAACSTPRPIALDELDPVLEAAGRFARDVLSPLNKVGDAAPSRLTQDGVATPPGFSEAYRRFCDDGWPSICAPPQRGGQGLSNLLGAAVTEIWAGANLAFAMCPEAAVGAVEALESHASHAIRERYVPPLVSGRWTAAMDLTEPQAGSDLSTLRTVAAPDGDGWLVSGRKIFISWGDHDLAENIVHLVLARTPEAPPGLKGLSLFLVPKAIPGGRGLAPNDLRAISLEHKMGIRASPTCVMALGERTGARGWLVGPLNGGLACLFTMMNRMRLGVGLHSTGLAERALQLARSYAQERRQGRNAAGVQRPIIEHADVRRMLLTMRTLTHAARCLTYAAAAALDGACDARGKPSSERAEQRAGLLTPLVKAWCSDIAVEVASLGVQVHGGAGYIDESEISQIYRDARIGPIFEGTNFIQAQDLVSRKVIRDGGMALGELLAEVESVARRVTERSQELLCLAEPLLAEARLLRAAAQRLVESHAAQPELASCVAYAFLQWLGTVAGGWQWALTAEQALRTATASAATPDGPRALLLAAQFYAAHVLPRARVHAAAVEHPEVLGALQPAEI